MKNKRLMLVMLAIVAAITMFGPSVNSAAAVTRWVNDDRPAVPPSGTSCNNPGFNRIQDAVNAAAPGDTINVCPGTYPEQVTIPAGKNNLTLRSTSILAAIIKPPVVMVDPGDLVHVAGARNTTLFGFTITGPFPDAQFCSLFARTGVRVDGGGSANILLNHITKIESTSPSLRGCQNGLGILVGSLREAQVGSAQIQGNFIDEYQKGGIVIDNTGSTASIENNVVLGIGPTPVIAQNGIQISDGANADVTSNRVSDNTYTLAPAFSSTGILLFQAGSITRITRNNAERNDDNVGTYTTSFARISDNNLTKSTFFDGIFMDFDTSNNRITNNFLRQNAEHDCHDDSAGAGTAGTANFWINNNGRTQNRPGLCKERRRDNDGDDRDDDRDDKDEGKDRDNSRGDSSINMNMGRSFTAPKMRAQPMQ
jgi:hypothetical protein